MSRRVIIVHGYSGYPEKNWFPWLASELAKHDIEATIPAMPDSMRPNMKVWVKLLQETVGIADDEVVLVGHSIGGTTILRYLETLQSQKIRGAIVVAAPLLPLEKEHLLGMNHYFESPFDFSKIKRAASTICAVYSTDDPAVAIASGHIARDQLADTYIEIPNGGHLNEKSGYATFPILLQEVLAMDNSL